MNDEIKNILDMLKDSVNNPILEDVDSFAEETYEYPNYFALDPNTKDCKLLLDYITNLQQERNDYKSRNEKAIEITNKIIDAGYDTNEVLTLAIKQLDVLQGVDKE